MELLIGFIVIGLILIIVKFGSELMDKYPLIETLLILSILLPFVLFVATLIGHIVLLLLK